MADFREFDGICKAIQVQIDQAYQRGYADGLSRGTHCGYKRGYERAQESMPNKALDQEPKTEQFAEWVATEIFDENWEYNKDAFAELACRKLAKLGIVRAEGGEWILVEPRENEE